MRYTGGTYLHEVILKREADSHKGDFGRILLFAGSAGMAGAAVLCARGALKGGAGLVSFLVPSFEDTICPILQSTVPEATCIAYTPGMDLSRFDVVCAGPGIGKGAQSRRILSHIIETYTGVLVLDADALNIISESEQLSALVGDSCADVIITPHPGEAKRLLGIKEGELFSVAHTHARTDVAGGLTQKFNSVTVLKGSRSIVAYKLPDGFVDMYENTTGNPGMATAGSGDVLSGLIAALAGQKYSPSDAARIGVYIHGLAGDLAAEDKGEMGVTSSDIAENIPYALKAYYK